MAITDLDALFRGLNAARELAVNKASITGQVIGGQSSMWRATGYPTQAAIPGAAAVCSDATTGALPLPARTTGQNRVLAGMNLYNNQAGQCHYLEDRLAHMGGLSGIVTTAQTAGVDVSVATSNMAVRIGASDYSEVRWWIECYTALGATGVNATCAVTYGDATTGNEVVAIPASMPAGHRVAIAPTNGKWIKSVQTVTLSATTGTAGSFGVTATRQHGRLTALVASREEAADWAQLRAREIPDNACLQFGMLCVNGATGIVVGAVFLAVA